LLRTHLTDPHSNGFRDDSVVHLFHQTGRRDVDTVGLRFAAALMHSVAGARLRVELQSGNSTTVSFEPDADFSPCDWRSIVAAACITDVDERGEYPSQVTGLQFERGLDLCGHTVRNTHEGKLEFWFASTLDPDHLRDIFTAYEAPIHPATLDASIFGDTKLCVTLGRLREVAPCSRQHLHAMATDLVHQAAVTELIGDGIWSVSRGRA
jgi:hypothetical protein